MLLLRSVAGYPLVYIHTLLTTTAVYPVVAVSQARSYPGSMGIFSPSRLFGCLPLRWRLVPGVTAVVVPGICTNKMHALPMHGVMHGVVS